MANSKRGKPYRGNADKLRPAADCLRWYHLGGKNHVVTIEEITKETAKRFKTNETFQMLKTYFKGGELGLGFTCQANFDAMEYDERSEFKKVKGGMGLGSDTSKWIGATVELFTVMAQNGKPGIRVRRPTTNQTPDAGGFDYGATEEEATSAVDNYLENQNGEPGSGQ